MKGFSEVLASFARNMFGGNVVLFTQWLKRLTSKCHAGGETMIIPTVDQTEGIWIERTSNQGDHYIQAVFFKEGYPDQIHRSNCRKLIQRGSLRPEHTDDLQPVQREWDQKQRYHRMHV